MCEVELRFLNFLKMATPRMRARFRLAFEHIDDAVVLRSKLRYYARAQCPIWRSLEISAFDLEAVYMKVWDENVANFVWLRPVSHIASAWRTVSELVAPP